MSTAVKSTATAEECRARAESLVAFFNAAPTGFHAVAEAKRQLSAAGFVELSERAEWALEAGGKYFFSRNSSALVAFAVGAKFKPGNGAFMVGAHTDSPCLKLKPVSKADSVGVLEIAVQTYGGGLWSTWFDRDLGVAGRVLVKGADGAIAQHLVRIDRPICRIPMLAIHMARGTGTKIEINPEDHLKAVLCSSVEESVNVGDAASTTVETSGEGGGAAAADAEPGTHANQAHHAGLVRAIAAEIGVAPETIVDFELQLHDTQPSAIGGLYDEYIFSGRIDNLSSCYTSLAALLESTAEADSLQEETGLRIIVHFDHEEVGSNSAPGAQGPLIEHTLKRVTDFFSAGASSTQAYERAVQNSFMISCDCAHAVHPNYVSRHEAAHRPKINGGVVIKHNVNQRYATTSVGAFIYRECGRLSGTPTQDFVVRQDTGCGSTIGPITASNVGVNTVDVGMPQWSMHSVRETMGSKDPEYCTRQLRTFFETASSLVPSVDVDSAPKKQPKI
eukprot:INCI15396.2.p1 GENE.INCI15396.2~~INCI15396.2.p1  ORF type:complete len:505 (+),score=92.53 INCI15396.2:112-1626(+)